MESDDYLDEFTDKFEKGDIPLNVRQRCAIQFLYLSGKNGAETYKALKAAYGSSTLSRSVVFRWWNHFSRGHLNIMDRYRSGRPISVLTDENIAKAKDILKENEKISLRNLAKLLSISPGGAKLIKLKIEEDSLPKAKTDIQLCTVDPQESDEDDHVNDPLHFVVDPLIDVSKFTVVDIENLTTKKDPPLSSDSDDGAGFKGFPEPDNNSLMVDNNSQKRKISEEDANSNSSKKEKTGPWTTEESGNDLETHLDVEEYPICDVKVECV